MAKGDLEITYFGGPDNPKPCSGLDYSRPYTCLEPNSLAPGSVNTQSINGFLCSSPWVASSPYTNAFVAGEFIMGIFPYVYQVQTLNDLALAIVVTNIAVYWSDWPISISNPAALPTLTVIYTWNQPVEVSARYVIPGGGYAVSFVEVNGTVYFTALAFNGVFSVSGFAPTVTLVSPYVCGAYIIELAGRLVIGETRFPTGGGPTGNLITPTIAWSALGVYTDWDPLLNPQAGFNLLADVPDQITGLATVGRSALILRQNGITQQDPNGNFSTSGVQPFIWYHLWASPQGVGAFSGSVSQFGQTVAFLSSDNGYTISLAAGLMPIGIKIIARINADRKIYDGQVGAGNTIAGFAWLPWWYFGTIVNISGELHYLLSFSAYTSSPGSVNSAALVYDYNFSDNSWNFWDMSQYVQQDGTTGISALFFSIPFVLSAERNTVAQSFATPSNAGVFSPVFLFFGAITSSHAGSPSSSTSGQLFQIVPFNYDFASNPVTAFLATLYPPLAIPQTTMRFRGEVVSLGHDIRGRRIRIQADNAPMPTIVASSQQQALFSLTGQGVSSTTAPTVNMEGNTSAVTLKTYYGDLKLNDEILQVGITSVNTAGNPWKNFCAFRLSSVSLILNDPKGTTQ